MTPIIAPATLLAAADPAAQGGRGGATVVFIVIVLVIVGFVGGLVTYTVRRDRRLSDDGGDAITQSPDDEDKAT